MKKLKALIVAVVVTIGSFAVAVPSARATVDDTPDCDNVAIIRCGAFDESTLKSKYRANEGNVQDVYASFGLSEKSLSGFVDGIVWRDGRVTVGDKTVATGAQTAGRNYGGTPIEGTNAGTYSTSKFVTEGQTAFIKMDGNTFAYAVIKSCGNPVKATPVEKPTPKEEVAKPVYSCDGLDAIEIDDSTYRFETEATAEDGASISGYTYTFGDGEVERVDASETTIEHTYATPGTYTASVKVGVDVDDKTYSARSDDCRASVTIPKKDIPVKVKDLEVCRLSDYKVMTIDADAFDETKYSKDTENCEKPIEYIKVCDLDTHKIVKIDETDFDSDKHSKTLDKCKVVKPAATKPKPVAPTPAQLPETGTVDVLSGSVGIGSVAGAGYYYLASRRRL